MLKPYFLIFRGFVFLMLDNNVSLLICIDFCTDLIQTLEKLQKQ